MEIDDMSTETIEKYLKTRIEELFPKLFKGCGFNFEVNKTGSINVPCNNIYIKDSLPALYKAVELSKKITGL